MTQKITVIKSTTTKAPKGYEIVELVYKTEEDKTKGMKIFNLGDLKQVAEVAKVATTGDILDAEFKQNDKGFWQFASLVATGSKAATENTTNKNMVSSTSDKPRGNWETSEERAARQVMIVRQSSLSTAVALAAASNPKGASVTTDDIIRIAQDFEAYVLDKGDVE